MSARPTHRLLPASRVASRVARDRAAAQSTGGGAARAAAAGLATSRSSPRRARCSAARTRGSRTTAARDGDAAVGARRALRRGGPGLAPRGAARPSAATALRALAPARARRPASARRSSAAAARVRERRARGHGAPSSSRAWPPGTAPASTATPTACGQELTTLVGVAHKTLPVRHEGRGRLRGPQHRRPGRRPRPVRQGHDLGPHLGHGRAARLHRDGAHRRARPARLAQSR